MAENSKIEWTHHTANLWHGCTKVHAGCDNCYAEIQAKRWGNDIWGNDKSRKEIKSVWQDLAKFQILAYAHAEMHTVFVGSMMDIFEKPMPLIDSKQNQIQGKDTGWLRDLLFQQISAGLYPNLIFLFLTKRPGNIGKFIPMQWVTNPPSNVYFGCSPVSQVTADMLLPQLAKVKGKKFLSIEPQLEQIDLKKIPLQNVIGIDWIINGGESGPKKRPFNLTWARILRDQCQELKIPFFFKQIDKIRDKIEGIPGDLQIRETPDYFKSRIKL